MQRTFSIENFPMNKYSPKSFWNYFVHNANRRTLSIGSWDLMMTRYHINHMDTSIVATPFSLIVDFETILCAHLAIDFYFLVDSTNFSMWLWTTDLKSNCWSLALLMTMLRIHIAIWPQKGNKYILKSKVLGSHVLVGPSNRLKNSQG
jgi:hypothetical protein